MLRPPSDVGQFVDIGIGQVWIFDAKARVDRLTKILAPLDREFESVIEQF